jgi:hypothetical protein
MTSTTMSAREFNQNAGGAEQAAREGPVFIPDRGRPSHVLSIFEAYERLTGGGPRSLGRLIGVPCRRGAPA